MSPWTCTRVGGACCLPKQQQHCLPRTSMSSVNLVKSATISTNIMLMAWIFSSYQAGCQSLSMSRQFLFQFECKRHSGIYNAHSVCFHIYIVLMWLLAQKDNEFLLYYLPIFGKSAHWQNTVVLHCDLSFQTDLSCQFFCKYRVSLMCLFIEEYWFNHRSLWYRKQI